MTGEGTGKRYLKLDGRGKIIPPAFWLVEIYFNQAGYSTSIAQEFYEYFESKAWRNPKGKVIKNWKMNAWIWIWNKVKK